jgi:hypothetical protein
MYDADSAALRTPSGDVAFYVEAARAAGGPVPELGCGSGQLSSSSPRLGSVRWRRYMS